MWQRRLVALIVLIGVGFVIPSASASVSLPDPVQLPRPTRAAQAVPEHSTAITVKLAEGGALDEGLLARSGASVVGEIEQTGFVKINAAGDPAALAAVLRREPSVESATVDIARRAFVDPNDPLYPTYQQAYYNTVRMPAAWDRITDASSQVIAIVDTGVDTGHPDLVGRTVPGYNAVAPGTAPTDELGHGTMVAGIVAANTNNGLGVAGTAWNARIMPVKVFTGQVAYDSDIARGILWAMDHGAKIINMSLGGPGDSPLLHSVIQYVTSRGVLVIAASGNTGNDIPQFPAAYSEVLAVGATDHNGKLTDFSSFGEWLDLAAPGFDIVSTLPGAGFGIGDGTSFAAPIVSGAVALLRAANPTFTNTQLADRLRASARDAGPRGIDPYYGYGVLDVARALDAPFAADFSLGAPGTGEQNDVPARANLISGGTATGSFYAEGDVDWYRYDETVNRSITITAGVPAAFDATWPQNVDPVLEVYNAQLGKLATVDNQGPGVAESVTLDVNAGTYYIKLRNYNGAADARSYAVSVALGATTLFAPFAATAVGSFAKNVAIGDVTGDGRPDVLLSTESYFDPTNDYKLFVFVQQPDGTLAPFVRYTPVQSAISTFTLLDVDRDGRLDVAVAGSSGVEVFRQTLAGTLTSDGLLPGVTGPVTYTHTVDIDGDGDDDLLLSMSDGITLATHGAGSSFAASSVTADPPGELEAGDVDGDGRVDIATVFGGFVRVYHNTLSGWVRTEHDSIRGYWPNLWGLEVADVTGDGRADIIASNSGNSPSALINVFKQNIDGTLTPTAYPTVDIPEPVDAVDINGDGRPDVVTANGGYSRVSVLFQQVDGTLAPYVSAPVPYASHYWPQALALGDIDSDGLNDVVLADYNSGLVVLRHKAATVVSPDAQEFVRTTSVADFASGQALGVAPTVTFQVGLDPSSVTADTVRLVDGRNGTTVPAGLAYNAGSKTVTITPDSPLGDNKPYRIVVNGVHDSGGNPQPWPFTLTFRTVDTAPTALAGFTVQGLTGAVHMAWSTPGDLDQVIVRMAPGTTPPDSPTAGTAAYTGVDSAITIGGLTPGTTYSFAAYYKDRAGQLSPPRTATLFGTAVSMEVTSGSSTVSTTSTLTFAATLTRVDPAGPVAGQAVDLLVTCRGRLIDEVAATATTSDSGAVSADVHQILANCSYRWALRGSSQFMGATSDTVEVTASIPMPPGGPPNRRG